MLFPPFSVFARALFETADERLAASLSNRFAELAENRLVNTLKLFDAEKELLFISAGPAPIRRRENLYRYSVIIKLARTKNTSRAVSVLWDIADGFNEDGFRGIDINPNDML